MALCTHVDELDLPRKRLLQRIRTHDADEDPREDEGDEEDPDDDVGDAEGAAADEPHVVVHVQEVVEREQLEERDQRVAQPAATTRKPHFVQVIVELNLG